ncbi:MAG: hypothetical protein HY363_05715 [Candidatus Aenigmarchaeota archaeon]|nr:hypothetical protein [Candidatus Aenigmarchaeota archaeon]
MTVYEYFSVKAGELRNVLSVWVERSLHSSADGAFLQLSVSWSPDYDAKNGEVTLTLDALLKSPVLLGRYGFVEKNSGTNRHTFVEKRAYDIPEQDIVDLLSGFYYVYFDYCKPEGSMLDDRDLPAAPDGSIIDDSGGIVYGLQVAHEQGAVNVKYTIEAETGYSGILDAVFKRFSEEVDNIGFSIKMADEIKKKGLQNDALPEQENGFFSSKSDW